MDTRLRDDLRTPIRDTSSRLIRDLARSTGARFARPLLGPPPQLVHAQQREHAVAKRVDDERVSEAFSTARIGFIWPVVSATQSSEAT
ncbi:MAG TPA: hypothetical protein VFG22_03290 [Polyangiales bacterium]|nr:hypothetical protein [Polyangiales bacterium]